MVSSLLTDSSHFKITLSSVNGRDISIPLLGQTPSWSRRVSFGYVLEVEIHVRSGGRSIVCGVHDTFVAYEGAEERTVHCHGDSARFIFITAPYGYIRDLLRCEGCRLVSHERCVRMIRDDCVLCKLPANLSEQQLASDLISCPYQCGMRDAYLELKGMEFILEMLSLYFVKNEDLNEVLSARSRVRQAWEIMCARMENPISISELARKVYMSESTLKRLFQNIYGSTIFSAFQRYRMNCARSLLEDGDLTVSEIAFKLGYSQPGHFSRAFAKFYGYPPTECGRPDSGRA